MSHTRPFDKSLNKLPYLDRYGFGLYDSECTLTTSKSHKIRRPLCKKEIKAVDAVEAEDDFDGDLVETDDYYDESGDTVFYSKNLIQSNSN